MLSAIKQGIQERKEELGEDTGLRRKTLQIAGLTILLFGMICSGCRQKTAVNAEQKDSEQIEYAATESTETASESEKQETKKLVIEDLDDAYEALLDSCSKEFIGDYRIDESFLNWIYANYGKDAVLNIAKESQEEQDVNIWYKETGNSIHVLWLLYCQATGMNEEDLQQVYWKTCNSPDEIVLDFTGDINFAEGWGTTEHMDGQPNGINDCFSKDLLQEMNNADIMMINNEFTYSTRGEPLAGKDYTFRADPKRVDLLETFGTDIVSLANNHVYDYGKAALIDTIDTLEEAGIPYVGAGKDLKDAMRPVYFVANGKKIAIVSATQIERSLNYTKEATETTPGVLKTLNPDKFLKVIEEARDNSDYVIAFVHWGTEGNNYFGSDQVALAKQFVEAGVDVIIGGHTHCLQGMEYMDGVPIIYSLGNFWFSASTLDTGLSQVIIRDDGTIDFRFLPCIQKNYKTSLVTDESEKRRIFDFMESLSVGITIDDDGYVTATE